MHVPAFLTQLVVVFGVAVVVVLVLSRLRLPTIAGFIAAGALIGPGGLGLVGAGGAERRQIEALAEVGVVLLLFTIGLEFSLGRLRRMWRTLVLGGSLQVGLTICATVAVAVLGFGEPGRHAVFHGFLVAMSSTAIVLRALAERRETDAPHGRMMVGVLVFQDLCVVPMMLLVPMLGAGAGPASPLAIAFALAKAAAIVVGTVVLARLVAPRVLGIVAATRQRELFLLAALLACVGIAWLTTLAGLSLALGAFLAGVALADSEYGHQALADVLPFREAFTSLFFISVGMLFAPQVVMAQPLTVLGLVALVLVGKGLIAAAAASVIGFPLRAAVIAGAGLAGIGEFSFVLAQAGAAPAVGLLAPADLDLFVAVSVITILITPLAMRAGPTLAAGAARLRRLETSLGAYDGAAPEPEATAGHVVIAGYGVAGRLLGEALSATAVPWVAVELNPETVRAARAQGQPLHYGDVTSMETFERVGLARARELVIMINDPEAARRSLAGVRRLAPRLPVVVRTKYLAEVEPLRKLGATDVVVEEFETAMEIMARSLRGAGVARNVIHERVTHARRLGAPLARPLTVPRRMLGESHELAELKFETFLVGESHWAVGRTIAEFHLVAAGAGFVVAIGRGGQTHTTPKAFETFAQGDLIYVVASGAQVGAALDLLERGPDAGALP
jgi:CPA2 family monovalent cation:H+ antiporter-2